MKEGILIIILGVMILGIVSINKKLNRLIELSQPEALNIIDEKFVLEKKL